MSTFTMPLVVSPLENGRDWRLVEPFEYVLGDKDAPFTIRVPAGFVTDFASVPRFLWFVFHPTGRYGKAAVVHDLCYRGHLFSRVVADAIFLEAMEVLGVAAWKRWMMYMAVRLFGRGAWKAGDKLIDQTRSLIRAAKTAP